MTHAVPSEILDPRLAHRRLKPVLVPQPWNSLNTNKNRPSAIQRPLLQHFERGNCHQIQRDMSVSTVLALGDEDYLARQVDAAPREAVLFAGSHAAVEGDLRLWQVFGIILCDHRPQATPRLGTLSDNRNQSTAQGYNRSLPYSWPHPV